MISPKGWAKEIGPPLSLLVAGSPSSASASSPPSVVGCRPWSVLDQEYAGRTLTCSSESLENIAYKSQVLHFCPLGITYGDTSNNINAMVLKSTGDACVFSVLEVLYESSLFI